MPMLKGISFYLLEFKVSNLILNKYLIICFQGLSFKNALPTRHSQYTVTIWTPIKDQWILCRVLGKRHISIVLVLYWSLMGCSLNLQRVRNTNLRVWSFPRSSSLQKISICQEKNKIINKDINCSELLQFTSLYLSGAKSFVATNFFKWLIVAEEEQRTKRRLKFFKLLLIHSSCKLT